MLDLLKELTGEKEILPLILHKLNGKLFEINFERYC
jgi:hypothetical protein